MKKGLYIFILETALICLAFLAQCGNPSMVKWKIAHPFEQKVIIENKGQYSIEGKVASKDILFGARGEGLQYYFTANSIWVKRIVAVKRTEKEIEELKAKIGEGESRGDDNDDDELDYKYIDEFHEISFIGANPLAELMTDSEVDCYYSFTIKGKAIKAHAWKKLTYHNLYPGIDMEFYFPEDKEGFEYSFIVHPGADLAQIKIQYPLNAGIMHIANNIIVRSAFGSFTEHLPFAGQNNKTVNCSSSLNNLTVEFNVDDYDKTQDLVIDPWVTVPTFTGTNSAYDVDWDNAGNCYIYGGSPPWQIIKYNSSGTMLWSYTESFDIPSIGVSYGDFAVDRNSQSVYIIQGAGPGSVGGVGGAEIEKLNSSGTMVKSWSGDPNFNEMWRIAFNSCTEQAVIAGGGTSDPTYTGYYLDTTLTKFAGVNILNIADCCNDMWGITIDKGGNYAYLGTLGGDAGNDLIKVGMPSLSPVIWNVPDGYAFAEKCCSAFDYAYGTGTLGGHVGYDGIALCNTNLYSYDSHILKQWSTNNGNLVNSTVIDTNLNSIDWGGITCDQCDNIFLGDGTNIEQYNGNLALVNTITGTNTIYDVILGPNNMLYACGENFVEAIQVSLPYCNAIKVQNNINSPTCLNPSSGSDTLILSGGTPPYTVSWNTTPMQTGTIASNLPAGTFIAKISDMSCPPDTIFDTVALVISSRVNGTKATICVGDSAILIAPPNATDYTWFPSTGLSSTSGSSVIASPKTSITYSVICSNSNISGCIDTVQILVIVNPLPVISVTPDSATLLCSGQSISVVAGGANTYTWSPSTGLSATSGSSLTAMPLSTTSYIITGIDSNGCKNSTTLNISVTTALIVSQSPSICSGQSIILTAGGMDSYQWYPTTGLSSTTGDSVIAKPSFTTTYTVTGSANNGCPNQALPVIVTVNSSPVIQLTPAAPSVCFGQSINWNASGAEAYTWSPSVGLSSTTGNNIILNPITTTTYKVIGTDSIGCSDTITAVAYVDSLPIASFVINPPALCNSQQIQFINTSTGASTYLWDFGDGITDNSANPLHNYSKGGLYIIKLTATTANGCSDTTTATDSIKSVNYGVHIANAFTPGSSDEGNNIFKPEQILCSENQNYIFRIYSRWGELLYETTDPDQGWDGTYKGKTEPIDVYVYYIQYACGPCTQFIKGNVTLLK